MNMRHLQRRPRCSKRRNKKIWSWHQHGYSKTNQDGQDGIKVAWSKDIEGPEKTKMATQRPSKIAKMRPKLHRVQAWVASREDQDGTKEETRGLGAGAKN